MSSRAVSLGVRRLAAVLLLGGCSASTGPGSTNTDPDATPPAAGGSASQQPSTAGTAHAQAGTLAIDVTPNAGTSAGGSGGVVSCATQQADADVERMPVDIIVTIDNSGSMQDEIDAVESNINTKFASILQTSGVDYRVILVSRHEKKGRQTSICVLPPLSANTACPPTPDQPAFTERFYQYSLKVDSLNSLVLLVDTFDATVKDEFGLAPMGWGAWLRPNASKVFLEITDDNSTEMSAADFVTKITAKSAQFGTAAAPTFRFHSIIGIGEKPQVTEPWQPTEPVQTSTCTGNADTVENPGPVYQELSRSTGGLRFPLCQFTAFDAVFETIAKDVVSHAAIACDFPIPKPPMGQELDLSKVAVSYDAGDGNAAKTFGQAMSLSECQPDAFYIDSASGKILLCPDTCAAAQRGKAPKIDVLFTCEPTFVKPPK
jgi:hypothetical protein